VTTRDQMSQLFRMQFFGVGAPKNKATELSAVQTRAQSSRDAGLTHGRAENFFSWPSGAPTPEGGDLTCLLEPGCLAPR
jgi:hypothetical protein